MLSLTPVQLLPAGAERAGTGCLWAQGMFDNESVRSNKPRARAQPRHSGVQLFLPFSSSPPGLTPVGSCADGGHKTTSGDRRAEREAGG